VANARGDAAGLEHGGEQHGVLGAVAGRGASLLRETKK